jgi:Uma2 family endonuclease
MAFVIDDAQLPATLWSPNLSDEDFAALCAEHPDLHFETTGEGDIVVLPPTYFLTGVRNADICGQLRQWSQLDGRGFCTDSSAGFVLANGARRSPDAAWTLKSRVPQLASGDRYLHLCPDFIIELKSATDRPRLLRDKMDEYMANGAQLGWLIDPETKSVTIYRPGGAVETRTGLDRIDGEGPVAGFSLDLKFVWDPFAK